MNVVLIPVRGGSKSIPMKNIKKIAGYPLLYWATKAAEECDEVDAVYIATDSDEIRQTAESFGFTKVRTIGRSSTTASDEASTESVMLEFASSHEFDNIALVQATNPMLESRDLKGGFALLEREDTDSVISVVRQKRFTWKIDETGNAEPENYDIYKRPRRQEFDGYLVENGAYYITSREFLLSSGCRLSGRIKAYEMPGDTYYEIDEPEDWTIVENLLKKKIIDGIDNSNVNMERIKMFLTDCDGCLTDGGMYYSEAGDELKKFNTKDGYGLRMLHEHGIVTGIVTGENMELNRRRAKKLEIDIVRSGVRDKASVIREISKEYMIDISEIAYVGDDINDLEAIKMVGWGCCPADAEKCIQEESDYVAKKSGGNGVIREIADFILQGRVGK